MIAIILAQDFWPPAIHRPEGWVLEGPRRVHKRTLTRCCAEIVGGLCVEVCRTRRVRRWTISGQSKSNIQAPSCTAQLQRPVQKTSSIPILFAGLHERAILPEAFFFFDFIQWKPADTWPRDRCGRAQLVLLPSLADSLRLGADL